MTAPNVIICEGLDKVGKSTLIEGIQERLGSYAVVHFGKPKKIPLFEHDEQRYQVGSFQNIMSIIGSLGDRNLILDRSWIGESTYSPLYRGRSGDWVFELERLYDIDEVPGIRLILLTEDFKISRHFVSDGKSFDDTRREEEQALFIKAFERSIIPDKRMIWVTDPETGGFRSKEDILEEALA